MFTQSTSIIITSPPETVWKLLIDPNFEKQYFYGSKLKIDLRVGGEMIFEGTNESKNFVGKGIITELTPNESLSFNFLNSLSQFEDVPENYFPMSYLLEVLPKTQTKLTITQGARTQSEVDKCFKNWEEVLAKLKIIIDSSSNMWFF